MNAHTIDFLRPNRTPGLGWLLLAAGVVAIAVAIRLDQVQLEARTLHEQAIAQREHEDSIEHQRLEIAMRPKPEGRRLAAAARETLLPWLPTLRSVEAATAPPVYVLDFTVDPAKGRIHIEGEAPDFEQAVAYVERLGQIGGVVQPRLSSHELVTDPAAAHPAVRFTVDTNWTVDL